MSQHISDVTNGAKRIEWYDNHTFAVWHGGHTVNFYQLSVTDNEVYATSSISVGDFRTGEVTQEDVIDGIHGHFELLDN